MSFDFDEGASMPGSLASTMELPPQSPTSRCMNQLLEGGPLSLGQLTQFNPKGLPAAVQKGEYDTSSGFSPTRKNPQAPPGLSTQQLGGTFKLQQKGAISDAQKGNYFRPRPRLDTEWFQIPKPPKLAYQREQFFAQLLRKPKPAARKVLRKGKPRAQRSKPTVKPGPAGGLQGQKVSPLRRIGRSIHGADAQDTAAAETQSRADYGFAGFKMTGGDISRPGSSMEGFTRPRMRVLQPELQRPATAGPLQYQYSPSTVQSIISLKAIDPPKAEPQHRQKTQFIEMRIMGDIHKRELAASKRELIEIRQAIEAAQLTSAMKAELQRVAQASGEELDDQQAAASGWRAETGS